ncbi:BCCT family transporter [Brackiella oedipodis]|uniref:BCCT family transporter n=1 Tax=Brackiella oedipodis TaxID=124225 RepID=UPI000A02F92B|nr:choline BCCT transporter BetT [Brackiella oedipodis]
MSEHLEKTKPQAVDADATSQPSGNINAPVFITASVIILAIIAYAAIANDQAAATFSALQDAIVNNGGWYYVLTVALILLVCVFLAFSKYGNIRLGPDHSRPEYGYISWFAMLFSAGMGIGLMFYGVAEPVMHFLHPPHPGNEGTIDAAREALSLTFFHWGLHAWGIYALVAVILAFFSYRHNLPLTLRSAFYPIIGDRVNGPIGHAVDVFAVIGTLFGVATSLGFGVQQVNSGLHYLFPVIAESTTTQVILIVAVTSLATLSVVSGLDRGVKILSQLNITLAVLLLLFILFAGHTVDLLQSFVQNIGDYSSTLIGRTFNLYAYHKTDWLGGWTIFYWGWWLSWSPFVGLFIAKISRGRTIREFIIGVLLVPTGFTLMWMTFFGNSAIDLILNGGHESLAQTVDANTPVALFEFLSYFPLSQIFTYVALFMVVVFFVTSADSGALVMDMLCSHGETNRKVSYRIYWAAGSGVVAIVLLWFGGLEALQTMAIATALPFVTVLIFAVIGFFKALRIDDVQQEIARAAIAMPRVATAQNAANWRERLHVVVNFPDQNEVNKFINTTCYEACELVAEELQKANISAKVSKLSGENTGVRLETNHGDEIDFVYSVIPSVHQQPSFIDSDGKDHSSTEYYRAEVHLEKGGQGYDIMGWSREGVINDIVEQYQKHMHLLHNLSSN